MPSQISQAIIRTVIYADIFSYPLTGNEIRTWLIGVSLRSGSKLPLKNIKIIKKKRGYYFLINKESLVKIRKDRQKFSRKKMQLAGKTVKVLKIIPSVKFIGLTGALSMNNATQGDDIDLFIVTSPGLLWLTRFLSVILMELLRVRRRPDDISVNNKICLNMLADTNHLALPLSDQDLYGAHEVFQLKPLFDRENIYARFIYENNWAFKYLPNPRIRKSSPNKISKINRKPFIILRLLEKILRSLQLNYMEKKRTSEIIGNGLLKFHPRDARSWVMAEYRERLKNWGIR